MSDVRITVRVSPDLVDLLAQLREQHGATNSQLIRRAVRALAEIDTAADPIPVADAAEIARLLSEKARNGHVGAMGTLLRHHEQTAKAKPDEKAANPFDDLTPEPTAPTSKRGAKVKNLNDHRARRVS